MTTTTEAPEAVKTTPGRAGRRPSSEIAERDAQIVEQWKTGRTQVELAAEFNVSKQRIAQVLKRRGEKPGPHITAARRAARHVARSSATARRRADLVERGLQYVLDHPEAERGEVLLAIDTPPEDIAYVAKRLDVVGPHASRDAEVTTRNEKIVELFLQNVPTSEIAEQFGLDIRVVRRLVATTPDEVTATGAHKRRPRVWTRDELIDYMARFRAAPGSNSMAAYKKWAAGIEGAPSMETIVARLDGWNAAKRAAMLRDLSLPSDAADVEKTA